MVFGLAWPGASSDQGRVAALQASASGSYGELPLRFEPNRGQTDSKVRFVSRGGGYSLFLTQREAVLTLKKSAASAVVRMRPLGANPDASLEATERLGGHSNYLIGNDRSRWQQGVPGYGRVTQRGVYPGVDLVYRGSQGALEYDFVVAPGADPAPIGLAFSGAERLSLDARGDLVASTPAGSIRHKKPFVYQEVHGARQAVPARFVMEGRDRVGFSLGAYDRSRPLVIDPVLTYSTYLGGPAAPGLDRDLGYAGDLGNGIAVDASGSAFVTGETGSLQFPTKNAYQAQGRHGVDPTDSGTDAFVTKLNPQGSDLVYSTYLGGYNETSNQVRSPEYGTAIAVDGSGNAYVTGTSPANNFPITPGAHQQLPGAVFVAKLDAAGGLAYSTRLGGRTTYQDSGLAIAVRGGSVYVTGEAESSDFPVTPGADNKIRGLGFVAKLEPDETALDSDLSYSSYLGAPGTGIAVDAAGKVYLSGSSNRFSSVPVPTTPAAHQPSKSGVMDAFVIKLEPDTVADDSDLLYSTFLGGAGLDGGGGIAIDGSGTVYLAGWTESADFPTKNAAQTGYLGSRDAFVAKLEPDGEVGDSDLVFSSYLGGSQAEQPDVPPYSLGKNHGPPRPSIALDPGGGAYVAGLTMSRDFPIDDPVQAVAGDEGDAFVARFGSDGSLVYSTYLGGQTHDGGGGVAVDSAGSAYVTGWTGRARTSTTNDFPTTGGAFQRQAGGALDAFVAKLSLTSLPTVAAVSPRGGSRDGGTEVTLTGARLNGVTAVRFGDVPATFSVVSDKKIVATSPLHIDGDVPVTVVGPAGTSPANAAARFFFHGWSRTGDPGVARNGHTATLLAGGKVLVVGGCDGQRCPAGAAPMKSAELYDPKTGGWSSAGEMASPRASHSATLLANGKVLVTGGMDKKLDSVPAFQAPPVATAEIYDPQTNGWSAAGSLAQPRFAHTATLLGNGKVLVAGRGQPSGSGATSNGAELYDPAAAGGAGASTPIAGAPQLLAFHTATLLPSGPAAVCGAHCGKVLLVGMSVQGDDVIGGTESYLYDPASNSFATIPAPNTRRISHTATLLSDGKVLVAGGRGDPDVVNSRTGAAEVFDPLAPATAPWRYVATSATPRKGHAAALLPDGNVLTAGGVGSAILVATSEVFDPPTGSTGSGAWVLPGMATHREMRDANSAFRLTGPTATLLSSDPGSFKADPGVCGDKCGKVLVLGGSEGKVAELYTPLPDGFGASPPPAPTPTPTPTPEPTPVGSPSASGSPGAGGSPGATTGTTPGTGGAQTAGGEYTVPSSPAEKRRSSRLRRCLARVTRHRKREQRLAQRASTRKRSQARRHRTRHARRGRRACLKRYGRTPGRITGLTAQVRSRTEIELIFRAPGTDGRRGPAASAYLVKQSPRAITSAGAFRRAKSLCKGTCRFSPSAIGAKITLTITDLRPNTTYHYALAARDSLTGRLGPRSKTVRAKTR